MIPSASRTVSPVRCAWEAIEIATLPAVAATSPLQSHSGLPVSRAISRGEGLGLGATAAA